MVDLAYAFGLPPEKAVEYFQSKGYAMGLRWQDVWEQAHARAFTVAGVMKLDVLQDIRGALDKALKDGTTMRDFNAQLTPLLQSKGWLGKGYLVDQDSGEIHGKKLDARRLETIFRTNTQSAYMAGRWKSLWEDREARPVWVYSTVGDNRVRPRHKVLHGLVLAATDPFWRYYFPPNGWRCRCHVRALTRDQVTKQGLEVISSEGRLLKVEQASAPNGVKRKAMAFQTPSGARFVTDPGFGFNPGQAAFQPELDNYAAPVARQYVKGVLTGPEFGRWYQQLETAVAERLAAGQSVTTIRQEVAVGQRYPVAILDQDDMARLGSSSQTVWLSDNTLAKQFANRQGQNVALEDYWRVQQVLEQPALILAERDLHMKFIQRQGRWWVAVVKVTRNGAENWLQTFHPINERELERLKRGGKVIWERK